MSQVERVIPVAWLPPGRRVHRIIVHWTGGAYTVSALDKAHYHALISRDGTAVKGLIGAGFPAPHTRNLNTGSYGLSIAAMAGAQEGGPYGSFPMRQVQYERAAQACAEIVEAYSLALTERTVLCHQEVSYVYGPLASPPGPENLRQRGKWDVSELPWEPTRRPRREIWAEFRGKTAWYLQRLREEPRP